MTGCTDDMGMATVEAALGVAALVAVLVLCLAGLTAVSAQVRCVDAAREAVRLAARGDESAAMEAAYRVAPAGAAVRMRIEGAFVVAEVSVTPHLLPALVITGRGAAATEAPR